MVVAVTVCFVYLVSLLLLVGIKTITRVAVPPTATHLARIPSLSCLPAGICTRPGGAGGAFLKPDHLAFLVTSSYRNPTCCVVSVPSRDGVIGFWT